MTFQDVLAQVIAWLQREQRVSYRALKRQLALDDDYLEDLKDELIYAKQLAVDEEGRVLVWTGPTAADLPAALPGWVPNQAPLTYTPPHLTDKILAARPALEGERKQVTVLFADLKDSTELIRGLDPEAAQQLLDPALQRMMDAVHRFEGTVNQVLGDGIMALFGAPIAHEDHALRACYAALAMQAAMQPYTEAVRRSRGLELRMRVGLNSGEVVVRAIGNDLHMDYSAVGETTHLAARMEQLATPGSIRLSASTLGLVEGLVRVTALGLIPITGQVDPMAVFELTGVPTLRRRLQAAAARGLTRFVGRQHEVESLPTARLLLLVNYRPEYQHGWGSKTSYMQLRLDPLPPASADELLQALLGDDPSLAPLKPLLIARTEGNPFFLEESVRTLGETGVLVGEPGAYRLAKPLDSLQVPATVQAVLAARIDRLPPEEKRLLQTAAVVGTEVPLPLLQAIADAPEAVLHRGLAHLQAAEFLYETRLFPDQVYTFKHALTHEVAYSSLLQERRRGLHAQIVEALETLASDRRDEQVDLLAQHAVRGQVWDKALTYCRQAVAKAFAGSAYREAVGYLEQALEVLAHLPRDRTTLEQAVDVRCDLYSALHALAQFEQTLTHLHDAERLAEEIADQRRLGIVYRSLANILRIMRDYEPALAYCQRAHAMATAPGDVKLQLEVNLQMGWIYHNLGDCRQAMEYLQQALTALQGEPGYQSFVGDRSVIAHSWMVLCLSELGAFADGVASGNEALQIAEAVDRPYERLAAYWRVGYLHVRQGTLHQAIPLLERGVALGQDANIPGHYRPSAVHLALAYALAGRATDALPLLEQIDENPVVRGEAYLLAGEVDEADRLAQQGLANARDRKMRGTEARALWLLGEIAMRHDPPDVAQAEAHYRQALALAEELGMRPLVAHCHHGLGRLYHQTGRAAPACTALAAAIDLYRAMDMTLWLPQAEAALAQVEGQ